MTSGHQTRYARTSGADIAYQVFGDGDRTIVWTPGFVSHLDLQWEDSNWASVARRVSSFARVLMFDKRGTGLSERTAIPSIEERMDDIRAVMDAAEIELAALVGYSGGPWRLAPLLRRDRLTRPSPPAYPQLAGVA